MLLRLAQAEGTRNANDGYTSLEEDVKMAAAGDLAINGNVAGSSKQEGRVREEWRRGGQLRDRGGRCLEWMIGG